MRTLGALFMLGGLFFGCAAGPSASAPPRSAPTSEAPTSEAPSPAPPESAAAPSETPNGSKLACSRPSDCGAGNACCTTPLWDGTFCAAECDLANNGRLCTDDRDCPELGGQQTRCAPVSPDDAPLLPASFKACQ